MPSGEAAALVVLGLLMGTVFTFGMNYWNRPVAREEARRVEATYAAHREASSASRGRVKVGGGSAIINSGAVRPIQLELTDHEPLTIDGSCVTEALTAQLRTLTPGETLVCAVHPDTDTVLEILAGDTCLLAFDDAAARLASEKTGFFYLGLFMYAGALYGLLNLIPGKRRR